MSKTLIAYRSNFPLLNFKNQKWNKANKKQVQKIKLLATKYIKNNDNIQKLSTSSEELIGYYRTLKKKALFLKILPGSNYYSQMKSDLLSNWLLKKGINSSVNLPGYPILSPKKQYSIMVYKLIKGRYFYNSKNNLKNLGFCLGKLHDTFLKCPWKNAIKHNGIDKHKKLKHLLSKVRKRNIKISILKNIFKILLSYKDDFDELITGAQVVHGDMNIGNILIEKNKMIFLDFEDTWSAWLNPYSELANAIQRFAITKSDRESFESSKYLIDSYFKSRTSTINFNIDIEKTLRTLSVRAFLLLIDLSSNGSKVKKCEWNKFLFFYNQTLKRKKLFNKISTHINRQQ